MAQEITTESVKNAKITIGLILLNSLIYIIANLIIGGAAVRFLAQENNLIIQGKELWGLFTSIFVHINFEHLLFNMISLFIFGVFCEANYSRKQYILIYLISGLMGSVFSFVFYLLQYYGTSVISIGLGSSGAIYGLMAAAFYRIPRGFNRMYIYGIIFVVWRLTTSLNNWAHIFGFGGGILCAIFIKKWELKRYRQKTKNRPNKIRFRRNQKTLSTQFQNPVSRTQEKKTEEQKTFDRFVTILQIEQSISINQMAEYLQINEVELLKRVVIWKKKLPFEISGDFLIIPNLDEFLRALERLPS